MDGKERNSVQIHCPTCGKAFPVIVEELMGRLRLSVRCPHCKRIGKLELQDISSAEKSA